MMGFGVTLTGRIGRESQRSGERVNLNLCGGSWGTRTWVYFLGSPTRPPQQGCLLCSGHRPGLQGMPGRKVRSPA